MPFGVFLFSGLDVRAAPLMCSRLLKPLLPPPSVAFPFEPTCFEKTAAFVSLFYPVEEEALFKGKAPREAETLASFSLFLVLLEC